MAAPEERSRQDYINMAQQIAETLRRPGALPLPAKANLIAEANLYLELAKLAPEEPTP